MFRYKLRGVEVREQAPPGPVATPAPDPRTVVEWTLLVPSRLRSFTVARSRASAVHGLPLELVDELVELGLPVQLTGGEPHLDAMDLDTAALQLGHPSIQRRAMRHWAQTLERAQALPVARYRLEYTPRATGRTAPGPEARALVAPGTWTGWPRTDQPLACRAECATRWPEPPAAARTVAARIGELRFFMVPPPLRDDPGFARETRLAGCSVAGELVLDECRAAGIECRRAFGLLLSMPYSIEHVWAELRAGDAWVPFDPHLLGTLASHAGLDPRCWPPTRSPGAVLARLGDRRGPVAERGGEPLEVTVITRLEEADG